MCPEGAQPPLREEILAQGYVEEDRITGKVWATCPIEKVS